MLEGAQIRATIAALGTAPVDSLSTHAQDVLLAAFRDHFSSCQEVQHDRSRQHRLLHRQAVRRTRNDRELGVG